MMTPRASRGGDTPAEATPYSRRAGLGMKSARYKNKMFSLQLGRTNSFIPGNTEVEKAWVSILTGWL